ncbi:hypothetical protein AB0O07_30310 [Streptomyces sp. NPDC093085]|uniref:hypothetical protein n=1 Tax=Streptomyces sp. NPDC093085 TaxID=3155068 RepID=UPI00341592E4
MTNLNMVFSADPRHGLIARSDWEQEEARTVLRDLGWEWEEQLHALVPPEEKPKVDAGVQAVEELHLRGYRTGYAVRPYGTIRLTLDRAEQVLTKAIMRDVSHLPPAGQLARADLHRLAYGDTSASAASVSPEEPEPPAI